MDHLESIIENLTSDEVRRFKILSNRFKADEEKKLLGLFDFIRSGEAATEPSPIARMYGEENDQTRNRYYRLRNKLLSNLEKSLLFYHFNYKNTLEAYNLIQMAVLLRERGLFRETWYYLRRAEKVALREDMFGALEIVYDEMVRLGAVFEVDVPAVLALRKENSEKLAIWRADQEVLALVTQELLRRNFARNQHSSSVIETLEALRKKLEAHARIFRSSSGRIMVLKTVVSILLQKEAYADLIEYVQATYAEFEAQGVLQDHAGLKMMMQIWQINALLKMLRTDGLEDSLDALWKDIDRNRKHLFREYAFYYYSASAYFHKLKGNLLEARQLLDEGLAELKGKSVFNQYWFLRLAQADTYFCLGEPHKSLRLLQEALSDPGTVHLDRFMVAYAQVFEAVCYAEVGDVFEALARLKELKKLAKGRLKEQTDLIYVLDLLTRLYREAPGRKATHGLTGLSSEIGGNQILLYDAYFLARNHPELTYYQAFLKEVQSRKGKNQL